jgi:hypothetical protein
MTTSDSCGVQNGSAKLSPANYAYTWDDGFVGAERSNLSAGQYQVTVSDQCAYKVIAVVIGSQCPCVVPEVISSLVIPAGCGGTLEGSIEFTMISTIGIPAMETKTRLIILQLVITA